MKATSARAISRIISEKLSGKSNKDGVNLSDIAKKMAQRKVELLNEDKNEEEDENVKK